MSRYLILLAVLSTFLAVGLLGLAANLSRDRRRRAVQLLEAQLGRTVPVTREEDLSRSFVARALVPFLRALGAVGTRLTPIGMRKRIGRKVVLMGSPPGWDADKLAAIKVMGAITGVGLGWLSAAALGREGLMYWSVILVMGGIGALLPGAMLDLKARSRQELIRRALPDTMDLLTISVEAGLGFDAALAQVVRSTDGPLAQEVARMLQEMQVGVARADALRNVSSRNDVDELKGFVLAMVQAEQFGVSIAKVLRSQAGQLRTKRRQRAEERAMKVPVKILFPLIFCILPAMFVVLLGPGIIKVASEFLGLF
jgi:tight adherence protein C